MIYCPCVALGPGDAARCSPSLYGPVGAAEHTAAGIVAAAEVVDIEHVQCGFAGAAAVNTAAGTGDIELALHVAAGAAAVNTTAGIVAAAIVEIELALFLDNPAV